MEVVRHIQTYKGIPVHGGGYLVDVDPGTGDVKEISGHFNHNIDTPTKPTFSEEDAYEVALTEMGAALCIYNVGGLYTPLEVTASFRHYMASGADTPNKARPLAITWRTALIRARRALRNPASSTRN